MFRLLFLLTLVACGEEVIPDGDRDGYNQLVDCDDDNPDVFPGAAEICDGLDNDCIDGVDNGVRATLYQDLDGDGSAGEVSVDACPAPNLYADWDDCDDGNELRAPGLEEICDGLDNDCDDQTDEGVLFTWFVDSDGDGFGDASASVDACDAPAGTVADSTDCNDALAAINPGMTELCNGLDDDCNGVADADAGLGLVRYYPDVDGDGYGGGGLTVDACEPPAGHAENQDDCDDADDRRFPGNLELCDGIDNDCDADVDEEAPGATVFYADVDGDGFGVSDEYHVGCAAPASTGWSFVPGDCDDSPAFGADINPLASELCNELDDDCNGQVDDGTSDAVMAWDDADGDGYGDPASADWYCDVPKKAVDNASDCDDEDADRSPDGDEVCDGFDNDCDGDIDDADGSVDLTGAPTYYVDVDGDGFGIDSTIVACAAPSGYADEDDDCDDAAAGVNPDALEQCNEIDDDCDDAVDEGVGRTWYVDNDGDGFGDPTTEAAQCTTPASGWVEVPGDCDDQDNAMTPETVWYRDGDGDGYGVDDITAVACARPDPLWTQTLGDCDDLDAASSPEGEEVCFLADWQVDGRDNNCDGIVDEDCPELLGGTVTGDVTLDGSYWLIDQWLVDGGTVTILPGTEIDAADGAGAFFGYEGPTTVNIDGLTWTGGLGLRFGEHSEGTVTDVDVSGLVGEDWPSALFIASKGDLAVSGLHVLGDGSGGGVLISQSAPSITDSSFEGVGFGVYCHDGDCLDVATPLSGLDCVDVGGACVRSTPDGVAAVQVDTFTGDADLLEVGGGEITDDATWPAIGMTVTGFVWVAGDLSFTVPTGAELSFSRAAAGLGAYEEATLTLGAATLAGAGGQGWNGVGVYNDASLVSAATISEAGMELSTTGEVAVGGSIETDVALVHYSADVTLDAVLVGDVYLMGDELGAFSPSIDGNTWVTVRGLSQLGETVFVDTDTTVTLLDDLVDEDLSWPALAVDVVVPSTLYIEGVDEPVLTMAGTYRMAESAQVVVGEMAAGELVAQGAVLTSMGSEMAGAWSGLVCESKARCELIGATISFAGGGSSNGCVSGLNADMVLTGAIIDTCALEGVYLWNGNLEMTGTLIDNTVADDPLNPVDGDGLVLDGAVDITEFSGNSIHHSDRYPVVTSMGSLTGLTGNNDYEHFVPADNASSPHPYDAIALDGGWATRSGSLGALGLDIRVLSSVNVGNDVHAPIIELTGPQTWLFEPNTALVVGDGELGDLVATGVTFTSQREFPASGDWHGLRFGEGASSVSHLADSTVAFAGSSASTTCNYPPGHESSYNPCAAIRLDNGTGARVTGTTVDTALHVGIWMLINQENIDDSNTFVDVDGIDVSVSLLDNYWGP
jgi:hypothetical protein